jgi:hypothetical protein
VPGTAYHVAVVVDVCDGGATTCNASLYVNGVLEGQKSMRSGSNNLAPVVNADPFRIGAAGGSGPTYSLAGGYVDDVAVYPKALTTQDIEDHYDFARGAI